MPEIDYGKFLKLVYTLSLCLLNTKSFLLLLSGKPYKGINIF